MAENDFPNEEPEDFQSPSDRAEAEEVTNFIRGFGSDCKVQVRMLRPGAATYGMVATVNAETFDPQSVIDKFGGGKYQFTIQSANGKYKGKKTIEVDPRIIGTIDQKPEDLARAPLPLPPGSDGNTAFLVKVMQDGQIQQQAMFERMEQMRRQSFQDMTALVIGLAPVIQAVLMRPPSASSGPSAGESKILEMLLAHTLAAKKESVNDMLDTLAKLKELGGDAPPQEGPGLLTQLLTNAAPLLLTALSPQGGNSALPAMRQAQAAPADPAQNVQWDVLRAQLVKLAAANAAPGAVVEVIEALVPREILEQLLPELAKPDWKEKVLKSLPEMAPYPAWLEEVREEFLNPTEDLPPYVNTGGTEDTHEQTGENSTQLNTDGSKTPSEAERQKLPGTKGNKRAKNAGDQKGT